MSYSVISTFLTFLDPCGLTLEGDNLEVKAVLQPQSVHDADQLHGQHVLSKVISDLKVTSGKTISWWTSSSMVDVIKLYKLQVLLGGSLKSTTHISVCACAHMCVYACI